MEDDKIVELYWDRDEAAITATSDKYGVYCLSISQNILLHLSYAPARRYIVRDPADYLFRREILSVRRVPVLSPLREYTF